MAITQRRRATTNRRYYSRVQRLLRNIYTIIEREISFLENFKDVEFFGKWKPRCDKLTCTMYNTQNAVTGEVNHESER